MPITSKDIVYSASSINTFEKCSYEFYLKKIVKLIETDPQSHYGFLGTTIHNSAFSAFSTFSEGQWGTITKTPDYEKAWNLYDYTFDNNITVGDSEFNQILKSEGSKFPERFWKKPAVEELNTQDVQTWKTWGNEMLSNAIDELCKHNIIGFEHTLKFDMDGKDFVGYVDVLCKDENGKIYFLDLKTEWKPPSENELNKKIQFILYSGGLKKTFGLDYYPEGYFIHLRTTKAIRFNMNEEYKRDAWAKIVNMFKAIDNQTFTKSTYLKKSLCPYCSYFSHCYGVDYAKEERKKFYDS